MPFGFPMMPFPWGSPAQSPWPSVPAVQPAQIVLPRQDPPVTPRENPPPPSKPPSSKSSLRSSPSVSDVDDSGGEERDPPEEIVPEAPISPSEDVKSYGELIKRMAAALGIDVQASTPKAADKIFEILRKDTSPSLALPMSTTMMEAVKVPWERPSSGPISNKRLDHMYRVQEKDAGFLFVHPKSNSLVVSAASKGKRIQSTPPDKEGKKLDLVAKRFYTAGALGVKMTNYVAYMARYNFDVWNSIEDLIDDLPQEKKARLRAAHKEGLTLSKQILSSAKHLCDTSAKTLSSAVGLRRYSWLRSSSLHPDTKTFIEDMPFDGEGLFNAATDSTLQDMDKKYKLSKSMSVTPTKSPRTTSGSRQWNRRSSSRSSPESSWKSKSPHQQRQKTPFHHKQKGQGQTSSQTKGGKGNKQSV